MTEAQDNTPGNTTPQHPADAMFDTLLAVVKARVFGKPEIAGELLRGLVTGPDSAFQVVLMLAQIAGFPAQMARERLVRAGADVAPIRPDVALLPDDEALALQITTAMANADRQTAFTLAADLVNGVETETPDAHGRYRVHRVISELVAACGHGGAVFTAVGAEVGDQSANRNLN